MLRLSRSESVSSVAWIPDNLNCIAAGTSMGWVKLYDDRVGNSSAAIAIMAHPATRPRNVKGIRASPFDFNVLATFSDVVGESVKIWDIRKMSTSAKSATSFPLFSIQPRAVNQRGVSSDTRGQHMLTVSDVSWSAARRGMLAVGTTSQKNVAFYTMFNQRAMATVNSATDNKSSSSTPLMTINLPGPVKSFSWQGVAMRQQLSALYDSGSDVDDSVVASLLGDRLSLPASSRGIGEDWEECNIELDGANSNPVSRLVESTEEDRRKADRRNRLSKQTGDEGALSQSQLSWTEVFRLSPYSPVSSALSDDQRFSRSRQLQQILRDYLSSRRQLWAAESSPTFDRLLVTTATGQLVDLHVRDRYPLCISKNGAVASVVSGGLARCELNRRDEHADKTQSVNWGDDCLGVFEIDTTIRRRCKAGYSAHASDNVEVMTSELDLAFRQVWHLTARSNSSDASDAGWIVWT